MRFRVMTYNIHRAIGIDRRFRPQRIAEVIDHHSPDLVLLQEVDDGVPRSGNLDLGRELATSIGYPHYAFGHTVTLRRGRYGNATLSRYPIDEERNIDLSIPGRKRRGCQHTRVSIERTSTISVSVDLFNVHLGLSAQERAHQVGKLARAADLTTPDERRVCLVAGDFNDWRSLLHPIFTEILSFHCATGRRGSGNGSIRTYPAFSPRGGLDRIYYRGAVRLLAARPCDLAISRVASDHLPVVADFELFGNECAATG